MSASLASDSDTSIASVTTDTPQPTPTTHKCLLEASAAEFIENGWKLLSEVHSKQEYPFGNVKSMLIGESKGIQHH